MVHLFDLRVCALKYLEKDCPVSAKTGIYRLMQDLDDLALLREYAANNSEAAYAELVARRIGFVYSAALRQMRDPHLAEEITQAVFIILAQKAGKISGKTVMAGWLFKTTRYAALAQIRAETKRARQEKEFQMESEVQTTATDELWNQLSPLLDEALAALGETDRQAVLLRFFENKSLAEVGKLLGIGEDTARKRISRALEKLHRHFNRRGVSSTTAILAEAISTNSIHAAPMSLAKTISTMAVAKGAAASASTLTLIKGALKIMAWTKVKTVTVIGVATILIVGTSTGVVEDLFKNLDSDPTSSSKLAALPPTLILRPTYYPTNGVGFQNPDGKSVVANTSFTEIIRHAYGFPTSVRMVLPKDLPSGQFDYLNSMTNHQRDVLREEIKKQFGLIAHVETNLTNALLLKIQNPEKLKAHLVQDKKSSGLGTFKMSRDKKNDEITGFETMQFAELMETIFQKPVVDQTGSDSFYEWKSKSEISSKGKSREDFWKLKIAELGLELVPTNMPIEMLVVEKAP